MLLGALLLSTWFHLAGADAVWTTLSVPAAESPFLDVRVITDGAVTYRNGLDPMLRNPADVDRRFLNYPRVWQSLYAWGLDQDDDQWFGLMLVTLFIAGLWLVTPPLSPMHALIMCGAIFSPATLLAIERGNTDLLMFFLLALALVLLRRTVVASLLFVLLAFMLKLFPLAALVALMGLPRKRALVLASIALVFALIYILLNFNDLMLIRQGTPHTPWLSYGVSTAELTAAKYGAAYATAARWLTLFTLAVIVWLTVRPHPRTEREPEPEGALLDSFRVGAACYVSTFLLGTNYYYRLIFLLLALPQLFAWTQRATRHAGLAWTGLIAASISFWSLSLEKVSIHLSPGEWIATIISRSGQWVLFGVLLHLLWATRSDWVRPNFSRQKDPLADKNSSAA